MTMLELKDERPNRSGRWFKLKRPVGRGQPNEREDVIKVETVLGNAGHFDLEGLDGPTGYLGTLLDEGIRAFQAGNGLKTDGILNPDGPTLSMAKRRLGGKLDPYTPPTLGQVEDHHQRLKRGEAGLLLHRPPAPVLRPIPGLPEVDGGVYVMNRRSADYLLRHLASDGEHARWTAADIADRGPAGVARARDLLDQIRERDPERADTYASGILAHLTDDAHKRAFLGGDPPAPRPLGILAAEAQEKPAAAPAGNAEAKHATTTFPAPTPIAPPPPAKEEAKTPEPPKTPEPQGGGESDEQQVSQIVVPMPPVPIPGVPGGKPPVPPNWDPFKTYPKPPDGWETSPLPGPGPTKPNAPDGTSGTTRQNGSQGTANRREPLSDAAMKDILRPLENRRGDATTQKGNDIVAKTCKDVLGEEFPDLADRIKHIGGANKDGEGRHLGEKHLPGPETPDDPHGRRGGNYPDLSWERDKNKADRAHANTTSTLKDGATPTAEERRQLAGLIGKVGENLVTAIPKLRPGMDEDEYREMVREKCREIFGKWRNHHPGAESDGGGEDGDGGS